MTTDPWEKDPTTDTAEHGARPWESDPVLESGTVNFGEYAKGFAGGFTKGLAGLAGAPIDISTALLEMVGLKPKKPQVGGKEWLLSQIKKAISVPDAPDTQVGRIIGRAGEELGAAAIPAAGMLRAARGIPPAIPAGRKIVQSFLDPVRRAPGAAVVGETAATIGAGTGAGVAKEVYPESPVAETAGQLLGGVAPTALGYTATGLVARGTRSLISRFSSKAQASAARKAVEDIMGGALTPSAKERLLKAKQLKEKAPGFEPTVSEITGDPSLVATQTELEKNAQGEFLNQLAERKNQSRKAIEKFSDTAAPRGDIDPEYVIDAANKRVSIYGDTIERQVNKNVLKQKDLAEGLPTIDKLTTGSQIREGINQARYNASAKMSLRAKELGIADENMTVQFDEWTDMLRDKYATASRFEDRDSTPAIFKQVMAEKKAATEAAEAAVEAGEDLPEEIITSFQDIKALRERISDDLIDSIGSANPNRRKVRFLVRLKKDVDGFVDSLDTVLGENYKQFRKEYFEQYVTPYESGIVFKVRSKDGTGFHKSFDETVADMFFGKQSGAKQYYANFADDPEMMQAIESSILDKLQNEVVQDGVVSGKKLASWIKNHQGSLTELPEIKAKIGNIKTTQESLLARQSQLASRRNNIENTALAKQLAKAGTGDIPADKIIESALESQTRMFSLKSLVKKDEAAFGALKRIVWQKATRGTPEQVLNYVQNHKKTLGVLLGPQHFKDINDIVEMRAMLDIVPTPQGKAYIPKPLEKLEEAIGMPIPQMGTRLYAFKTGRLSKSYLLPEIARNIIYKKGIRHAEALFKEALYDPKIAREMADSIRVQTFPEKKANRLYARLFALALPYLEERDYINIQTPRGNETTNKE